jgi:hypothetical protein
MPKEKTAAEAVESVIESFSTVLTEINSNQNNHREEERKPRYVVVRDHHRVSDREYDSPKDPAALSERDFWKRVITRHPDGTKISIVQYNNKIHRVYSA